VTTVWRSVLAPNPGVMTLDGTNSYVIGEPGGELVVVDPGPDHAGHRAAVLGLVGGDHVAAVVLTHMHPDHSEGAEPFAAEVGPAVPVLRAVDGTLREGQQLAAGLTVLVTPGHSSDSVSLTLGDPVAPEAVLTGDTVLGRGTTVVVYPDGSLAAYLTSLERLAGLGGATVLPGHGPVLPDLAATSAYYLQHRKERLEQVRRALAGGARTPQEVVEVVYADVDRSLWPAAEQSVRSQLDYLSALP
jgi:glyoxylase-like metal-dependent hydrolase (beta-lactamase superfamily II)